MAQSKLAITPVTLPVANLYVSTLHRHHAAIPAGFVWWCVAAINDTTNICAVAIAGRPTNRNNDDRQTVEVLRLASDGTPNACSALYGACARAARAIGAARIITYTLDSETGASLRGAGWKEEANNIQSQWTNGNTRVAAVNRPHMAEAKTRWALHFHDPITYNQTLTADTGSDQGLLFPQA